MPGEPRPSVLIVGGFATCRRSTTGRCAAGCWPRGVARVDIAPLWTPDWALATVLGFGSVLRRTGGRSCARTSPADARPIIVVGHSAGGIAARLAMADVPFNGRMARRGRRGRLPGHAGHAAWPGATAQPLPARRSRRRARSLTRVTPGAYFAPRTAYLSVGSAHQAPDSLPAACRAMARRGLRRSSSARRRQALGDGIVPALGGAPRRRRAAHLRRRRATA